MSKKPFVVVIALGLLSLPLASYGENTDKQRGQVKPGETDITNTKGESGEVPSKYTVMPVARGEKVEAEDHALLDATVKNAAGEEVGTIERLIKDSETGRIEYAMIQIGSSDQYKAYPWSAFKIDREKGNVVLNVTKEQLQPGLKSQDQSPDVTKVIERELQSLRATEPGKERRGLGITDQPAAAGPMGETHVGGGGPSGDRALPPGPAPQFEGAGEKK